jgi:hypothetical protein
MEVETSAPEALFGMAECAMDRYGTLMRDVGVVE